MKPENSIKSSLCYSLPSWASTLVTVERNDSPWTRRSQASPGWDSVSLNQLGSESKKAKLPFNNSLIIPAQGQVWWYLTVLGVLH